MSKNEINENSFKFKIDDVEPRLGKLPKEKFDKIFGKFYFGSPDQNKEFCNLGPTPFLMGIYKAYMQHFPLVFTPDDFWLLIIQAFSNHVNLNAEKLRHLFVDFEGKKTLKAYVSSGAIKIEQLKLEDFNSAISQLVNKIPEYVNESLINAMHPDFSTTTQDIKYVGSLSIMNSFKKYFNYEMHISGCGIPSVTLQGTIQDWEKILEKLQLLRKYEFDQWIDEIEPIIKKLIETRKGNVDIEFWKNMFQQKMINEKVYGPSGIGCSIQDVEYITGWILKFFPFDSEGHYELSDKIKPKFIEYCASQILNIPFKLIFDNTGEEFDMLFNAGFLGMDQNDKFEISSVIGYYITQGTIDENKRY